jgi:hypothetical protein
VVDPHFVVASMLQLWGDASGAKYVALVVTSNGAPQSAFRRGFDAITSDRFGPST